MVCIIAEPQKKLPVFKPGKRSIDAHRRIALYGHDAKCMKNFTLHFDKDNQCEHLDRLWFGEVCSPWKNMCAKSSHPSLKIVSLTQQNLILNLDKMSQNCAFHLKWSDACSSSRTDADKRSTFIRGNCQPCCRQRESTMLEE